MLRAAPDHSRRVLLITSVLPWPLHRNGGAQRTELIRQALRAAGCRVDTLALLPQPGVETPDQAELRRHGVEAAFPVDVALANRPRPRLLPAAVSSIRSLIHVRRLWRHRYEPVQEVVSWIRQREERYEAIFVRYLQTALLAGLDRRTPTTDPPVIVDVDDVDWQTLASKFAARPWPGISGRIGMALALKTVRDRCTRALPAFSALLVTNDQDARALADMGHHPLLLPNMPFSLSPAGPPPPRELPPAGSRPIVLFVGDLEFGPNATGLDWFLANCWPAVRGAVAEAVLRIVGRGLADDQQRRWSRIPGVEVVGFAEDLDREYAVAACTIAPTWWGGGTKIKVLEGAAMGRPGVATPHAVRGHEELAGGPSPGVIVAQDAPQFARGVIDLLKDPHRRQEMASAALVIAQRGLSFEAFSRIVARSLALAAGDRVAAR